MREVCTDFTIFIFITYGIMLIHFLNMTGPGYINLVELASSRAKFTIFAKLCEVLLNLNYLLHEFDHV